MGSGEMSARPRKGILSALSPAMIAFLAGMMILIASLANFLRFNAYPLFSPEVGLIVAGFALMAWLAAFLYRPISWLGRALLEGVLIFFAVDLNADHIAYAMIAGCIAALLVLTLKRSLLPFAGTMAFVIFIIGMLGIGVTPVARVTHSASVPTSANGPPAILHIILDEHIGIEGLPAGNQATPAMKKALSDFYLSRGFRLFGRAYSEHFHTVNAIPHIVRFAAPDTYGKSREGGYRLGPTPYFARLRQAGYRINVYQSEYLDFCTDAEVVACANYSSSSLELLPASGLSIGDRAGLIAVQFARLSTGVRMLAHVYQRAEMAFAGKGVALPDLGLSLEGRTSTVNGLAAIDKLARDLRYARPGDAYFAHILLPHYPYSLKRNCAFAETDAWLVRRDAVSLERRERAYFDQLHCATAKLDAVLRAFARSSGGRQGIVIVHGDHGSRITTLDPIVENEGRFSDRDLISGFSTLFAVRAPGIAPGYDGATLPVSTLVKTLAQSDFHAFPAAPIAAGAAMVMIDDAGWIPRKSHPLPKAWAGR